MKLISKMFLTTVLASAVMLSGSPAFAEEKAMPKEKGMKDEKAMPAKDEGKPAKKHVKKVNAKNPCSVNPCGKK
jgi:hypothetical protein